MSDEPESAVKQLRPRIATAAQEPIPEPAYPISEIAVGDVVSLNSSPVVQMTVADLTGTAKKKQVKCTWFGIDGELGEASFDTRCLWIVRKAE